MRARIHVHTFAMMSPFSIFIRVADEEKKKEETLPLKNKASKKERIIHLKKTPSFPAFVSGGRFF